jgi:hypothetical protein
MLTQSDTTNHKLDTNRTIGSIEKFQTVNFKRRMRRNQINSYTNINTIDMNNQLEKALVENEAYENQYVESFNHTGNLQQILTPQYNNSDKMN